MGILPKDFLETFNGREVRKFELLIKGEGSIRKGVQKPNHTVVLIVEFYRVYCSIFVNDQFLPVGSSALIHFQLGSEVQN